MKTIFTIAVFSCSLAVAQNDPGPAKWAPFPFLIGKWVGVGTGQFGDSRVAREYRYLMGGTYLIGTNRSDYDKQEKNPDGEIHDNWDIFSYDKLRAKYVLRQFHAEDITNTYTVDSSSAADGVIEFETESIENFGAGWNAKEVYQIIDDDTFVEIFHLAAPGKKYSEV